MTAAGTCNSSSILQTRCSASTTASAGMLRPLGNLMKVAHQLTNRIIMLAHVVGVPLATGFIQIAVLADFHSQSRAQKNIRCSHDVKPFLEEVLVRHLRPTLSA